MEVVRTARRVTVPLLLLGLLLAGLVVVPASGHAALVGSDPEPDADLSALPRSVELEFNEPIGSSAEVAVTAPDGEAVPVTSTRVDDRFVRADLDSSTARGDFVVAYRVVSVDGHPVSGQYAVTVTEGEQVARPAAVPVAQESFVHRHREHLLWGGLVAVVAVGLVVAPLLRRSSA
ncbi:hypothetical protein GCM10009821_02340 [Aeromicrobium halocynthiae]|uniref:CopC domain-containing protein n=1 Tax=Aeromicrobium halocynthiae TaxID=560557 RepID=A0ABN2VRM6_9ACTN